MMLKKLAKYLFRRIVVLVFSDLPWKTIKESDKIPHPEREEVNLDQLVCEHYGHRKVEMSNIEAYPAAFGWKCSRCGRYRLWQHAWTEK